MRKHVLNVYLYRGEHLKNHHVIWLRRNPMLTREGMRMIVNVILLACSSPKNCPLSVGSIVHTGEWAGNFDICSQSRSLLLHLLLSPLFHSAVVFFSSIHYGMLHWLKWLLIVLYITRISSVFVFAHFSICSPNCYFALFLSFLFRTMSRQVAVVSASKQIGSWLTLHRNVCENQKSGQ